MDELTKAWIAGFFDGEGCVHIRLRTDKPSSTQALECRITIVNTDRAPLDMLEAEYGGHINTTNTDAMKAKGHQQCSKWSLMGIRSERFVNDILPYARIKRPQLELYLYARSLLIDHHERTQELSEEKILERRRVIRLAGDMKRPHLAG